MTYLTSNLTSDTSGYNYNVKYFILYIILRIIKKRRQLATKLAQRLGIKYLNVRSLISWERLVAQSPFCAHFIGILILTAFQWFRKAGKAWKGLKNEKNANILRTSIGRFNFFFGDSGVTIFYFRGVQFFGGYNFLFSAIRKIEGGSNFLFSAIRKSDRGWSIFYFGILTLLVSIYGIHKFFCQIRVT